jgi:hypothetical protein
MFVAVIVVFAAVTGSLFLGRGSAQSAGTPRPDLSIGEQGPGPSLPAGSATWTPKRDPNGYSVTHNLPLTDSRVADFADFPLLLPTFLPAGSKMDHVTIVWDPQTGKRLVQIAIEGKHSGILTEQRIQERNEAYPEGIFITSETQPNGSVSRDLRSNVDGVGVSMAWSLSMNDEDIIKCFQSLKVPAKS